jgi:hypothetical protein
MENELRAKTEPHEPEPANDDRATVMERSTHSPKLKTNPK